MLRGVAVAILVLLSPPGHAQAPADTSDLDSIQRQLDQAKAARAAAARKKAAALAAAKRRQHEAPPPAPPPGIQPPVGDLEAERQNMVPSYKAIGLAWDSRGASAARTADTVEQAKQDALDACNATAAINGNADCYDSGITISPGSRFCYAVSRDSAGKVAGASNADLGAAREASLGQCSIAGTGCAVAYSGCNDS